jgi:hypothetical protein
MMSFREGEYTIDTGKGLVRVVGQLFIIGGALAVVNPQGQLIQAWAVGAWRSVEPDEAP